MQLAFGKKPYYFLCTNIIIFNNNLIEIRDLDIVDINVSITLILIITNKIKNVGAFTFR